MKMTDKAHAPKIAVICGPTATGKTALGVILAKEFGGEIVSADSMQIYKGMDIGTAKPSKEEMQGVPHHMIDIVEPYENYSVARYVMEANLCVEDILRRSKLPIIVGGTGLYIDSLVQGRDFASVAEDARLRRELEEKYDSHGGEALLCELRKIDPERALKLHHADKKRIVRALEVYYITGKTISAHDAETKALPPRYDAAVTALNFENRADLYSRIDERVDRMFSLGLMDEVSALFKSGVSKECTAMQAIGYKETAMALEGEITVPQAAELIKRESRRYAKRQLTWLSGRENIVWINWPNTPDFDLARRISANFFVSRGLK